MHGKKEDRELIAFALAGGKRDDEAAVRRRQREKLRAGFRVIAILCLLFAAVLAIALLRGALPSQAEIQYTQGTLRSVTWHEGPNPHFDIALEHENRVFDVDYALLTRDGKRLLDKIKPGMTARVGFTEQKIALGSRWRAWELAVDGQMLYELADVRARARRRLTGLWVLAGVLFVSAGVLWRLTRPPRRRKITF